MTDDVRPAPLIWFAGVGWDDTRGTDRRIVEELVADRTVVWMDPPSRRAWRGWRSALVPRPEETGSVVRYRIAAPPGATRWPTRGLSDLLRRIALRRARRAYPGSAIVVANPLAPLPADDAAARVLYVTDDWVAGAGMMGLSARLIGRTLRRNARRADALAVVSPPLQEGLGAWPAGLSAVLPNGAPAIPDRTPRAPGRLPIAVVMGQLNERTDIRALQAVLDAGIPLRIVGPMVARDASVQDAFRTLFAHPLADWQGAVPSEELEARLADAAVGLTAYLPTAFNRASSPLKTLEYLAHGLPVVSTELPASRWLDTPHVAVAGDTASFVEAVRAFIARSDDPAQERARQTFARAHSWRERADRLNALVAAAEETQRVPRSPRADSDLRSGVGG
ncbi:glycosyltransferase [uncultured Microbacterium sp.]|uniref:glycosyltransferase family protein n=1 Tax=uncultured Microbacterium sp. TaxID=191216 RepID=UPI0025F4FD00|nr:glycosyltransferase [uncultured Microbacterium sp.]